MICLSTYFRFNDLTYKKNGFMIFKVFKQCIGNPVCARSMHLHHKYEDL